MKRLVEKEEIKTTESGRNSRDKENEETTIRMKSTNSFGRRQKRVWQCGLDRKGLLCMEKALAKDNSCYLLTWIVKSFFLYKVWSHLWDSGC